MSTAQRGGFVCRCVVKLNDCRERLRPIGCEDTDLSSELLKFLRNFLVAVEPASIRSGSELNYEVFCHVSGVQWSVNGNNRPRRSPLKPL